jgi:hypothetical protein
MVEGADKSRVAAYAEEIAVTAEKHL